MTCSLILGFFDGVHTAHRAVIQSALDYADKQFKTVLITFKDSPSLYFTGKLEYIMPRKTSVQKIKELGVDEVVELEFSEIAKIKAEDYLKQICEKYKPASISTGFNHTFGFNKGGNSDFLYKNQNEYNYKYLCIEPKILDNEVVSSTLIKKCLKIGEIEKANKLLETNFFIEGKVIKGAQIGRQIGFPTANIEYPSNIVKIPFGVYYARYEGMPSILNWGMRPTVHNIKEPIAETHILAFSGDLYGKDIKIDIIKKIRDEKHFENLEELKLQIEKDIKTCLELSL